MIDFGLLASMIVAIGLPALLEQTRWPLSPAAVAATGAGRGSDGGTTTDANPGSTDLDRGSGRAQATDATPTSNDDRDGFLDVVLVPAMIGVLAGRLVAVAIDAPRSLTRPGDLLVIRSGVEFWPGVVAAALVVAWTARRELLSPVERLAAIAPLAMIGYAGYEATCPVRDGCFGPESPIGLQPPGLATTMLPIGLVVAAVVALAAVAVRRLVVAGHPPSLVLAVALTGVAAPRAVASFWLPAVGDGLTRPHLTSIALTVLGAAALVVTSRPRGREPA